MEFQPRDSMGQDRITPDSKLFDFIEERRRGWDSNPRRGVNPLRHFECRALDRTMRPLRNLKYQTTCVRKRHGRPKPSFRQETSGSRISSESRALDRTMRPLRNLKYQTTCVRKLHGRPKPKVSARKLQALGFREEARRERDLNPRGGANPQRHFQCRALGQTMRSLRIPTRPIESYRVAWKPPEGSSHGQHLRG